MAKQKRYWLSGGPWVPHRLSLLESEAWAARSVPLMRILDRLEIEHMRHAGTMNGQLAVSYGQFVQAGVSRKDINRAVKLGIDLGLIRTKPATTKVIGPLRPPTNYRLTYLPANGNGPTDEWAMVNSATARRAATRYRSAGRGKARGGLPTANPTTNQNNSAVPKIPSAGALSSQKHP